MALILAVITAIILLGNSLPNQTIPPSSSENPISVGCEPNLELNQWIIPDVDSSLETIYSEKESKTFVLIKRKAPIPAWKVIIGARKTRETDQKEVSEMEKIGVVKSAVPATEIGKEIYVGLGHCDGDPQKTCSDPIVQPTLFVVSEYGLNITPVPYWALPIGFKEKGSGQEGTDERTREGYYWYFDVYLDKDYFQSIINTGRTPTNDDLPCWTKLACGMGDIMGEERLRLWNNYLQTGTCFSPPTITPNAGHIRPQMQSLAVSDTPALIFKNEINITNISFDSSELFDTYSFLQKTSTDPLTIGATAIGTLSFNNNTLEISYLESDALLFSSPLPARKNFYSYQPVATVIKPEAKSLQLGSFTPQILPNSHYEWWTPACKPALYFYPEKPTALSVKVKPAGKITLSDPPYQVDGWQIIAYPNGQIRQQTLGTRQQITDNINPLTTYNSQLTTYSYLYYEADIEKVKVPQNGWIVKKEDLSSFFLTTLPRLGLNQKETSDFLNFWLDRLSLGKRWFIGLIDQDELNRIEPIEFSLQPDNFIRVRFYFEEIPSEQSMTNYQGLVLQWNLDNYNLLNILNSFSSSPARSGFTVVDWGGIIKGGNCQIPFKSL